MKFKQGREVVIKKAFYGDGRYYYGGYIRMVPLGTKAIIQNVINDGMLQLRLENKNYGSRGFWNVHPSEIKGCMPTKEEQEEQEQKFNSHLLDALSADVVEEETKDGSSFEPEFNAKAEFLIWVRKHFPELKRYAKKKIEYPILNEQIRTVKEATERAWIGVEEARDVYDGLSPECQKDFLKPIFSKFYCVTEDKDKKNYAAALENIVYALELSTREGFPYNEEDEKFEYKMEKQGIFM